MILGAVGKELRKIYTARIALDSGKDRLWLMELWGMKSDYPAKLLMNVARQTSREWCDDAVKMCQKLDRRMKSEKGIDSVGELKLLRCTGGQPMKPKIKEVIVVEGRYDKNGLSQVVDGVIVETGGFSIFKDQEKAALFRRLAAARGVIVLTDSDGAGFLIRNHLKGILPPEQVKQAYIPAYLRQGAAQAPPRPGGKAGSRGNASSDTAGGSAACWSYAGGGGETASAG